MAKLNNIRVPLIRTKPDPSKTPDPNDPNNYCMACNFKFAKRLNYIQHLVSIYHIPRPKSSKLRNPNNMKPTIGILSLYCDTCTKTFDTKKSYVQHLVKLHKMVLPNVYSEPENFDSSSLYCKVCNIMYKRKYHFISHLRRMHHTALSFCSDLIPNNNGKDTYCIVCDKTLCSRGSYLEHLFSLHLKKNTELYQGIDCTNPSKEDIRLKRYCTDCHKRILRRSLYHIHLKKIYSTKPLNCFSTADNSDVNNPNNHCTLCDKTLQRRAVYQKHMINVHYMLITGRRPIINSNATPVIDFLKKYCNVCDRVFTTMKGYQSHLSRYHHKESGRPKWSSSRVNRNAIPAIDEINRVCTACNKTYTNRLTYKVHLCNIHGITLPRPNRNVLQNATQFNRDIIPDFNDKENHCASFNRTYSNRAIYKRHLAAIRDMRERNIKQEDQNETSNIESVQTN